MSGSLPAGSRAFLAVSFWASQTLAATSLSWADERAEKTTVLAAAASKANPTVVTSQCQWVLQIRLIAILGDGGNAENCSIIGGRREASNASDRCTDRTTGAREMPRDSW